MPYPRGSQGVKSRGVNIWLKRVPFSLKLACEHEKDRKLAVCMFLCATCVWLQGMAFLHFFYYLKSSLLADLPFRPITLTTTAPRSKDIIMKAARTDPLVTKHFEPPTYISP
jgi:hypothetical protein